MTVQRYYSVKELFDVFEKKNKNHQQTDIASFVTWSAFSIFFF